MTKSKGAPPIQEEEEEVQAQAHQTCSGGDHRRLTPQTLGKPSGLIWHASSRSPGGGSDPRQPWLQPLPSLVHYSS